MPDMRFCYCCRVHHSLDEMRLFPTRVGYRWRCIRSIEAARRSTQERDLFGQRQTATNREMARLTADFATRYRTLRLRICE